MKKIKKILFPTDFSKASQNAFRYALRFADKLDASIELLHVVYPEYEALDLPVLSSQATKDKIEIAKEVAKSFVEQGLTQVETARQLEHIPLINSDVELGSPAKLITSVAKRDEVDLIIMGTREEHSAVEKVFGSTTTSVLAKSPCHVLIVPEKTAYHRPEIVTYATDLIEEDPYHIWQTSQILEPFNPIIHCVHISDQESEHPEVDFHELETFFEGHAPSVQINFHNIKDDSVVSGLEAFIQFHKVDFLVMFAPHRNIFERLFHRSQTQRMAYQTAIPLLVVRDVK